MMTVGHRELPHVLRDSEYTNMPSRILLLGHLSARLNHEILSVGPATLAVSLNRRTKIRPKFRRDIGTSVFSKSLRILCHVLAMLTMVALTRGAADAATPPNTVVLVLNSYHLGYSWSDNEMSGIVETFRNAPRHYELRTEYLDTKFHPGTELFAQQKNLMARKYRGLHIPVVLVADNPALEFALSCRRDIFPDAAIVFCGINGFDPTMLAGHRKVTGVAERLDTSLTVKTALALHPETREIFVVHDFTSTGLATRREAEADLKEFSGRVRLRFMENLGTSDMLAAIRHLDKGTLVLALSYSRDKDGIIYDHTRIAGLLGKHSAVPVYGTHEERIGHGILGGSLMGGYAQGNAAARLALRILEGEDADGIPVQTGSPARLMFDDRQLVRYGISAQTLPQATVIMNQPESFYRTHTVFVWAIVGAISGLVLIIFLLAVNISLHRKAERAIAGKAAELERTNAELQEFNMLAYHTLQEPLRGIGGFVQLLERKYRNRLDAEALEYIGFAVQGVSRMKQLFLDFLAYTRQTRDEAAMTDVDLNAILAGVREDLAEAIAASGTHIDHGYLPHVTGNQGQLRLLFYHLLDNAIKFRGEAVPNILVEAGLEGGELRISVSDNGIGIEPAHHERVFRIFERLHHQDRYPGTGIGLALCSKIVALHGGRMWLDSASGRGTTFHFTLKYVNI